MFSIAAINDTESRGKWEPLAPSKEAQEFHLSQTYHEGLLKLQAKDYVKACELLEAVLKDPLISGAQVGGNASDSHLLQLRFLSLKNLATVFLQQGAMHYDKALQCYLQAVEIDSKDSVVWNQLGTLSCSMGLLSTSRWAFEQGLLCSPNNWNCMEKLLEILIAIGDEVSCLSVADLILRHWPSHSRALHVKKTIEDVEPIPFAPRGIDKLEPKHVRLKFSTKRKAEEDEIEDSSSFKRQNQGIEIYLAEATWKALADAILGILLPENEKTSEQETGCTQSTMANEIEADRHVNLTGMARGIVDSEMCGRNNRHANVKIIIHFPPGIEGKGVGLSVGGENMPVADYDFEKIGTVKEQENYAEEEHPQERRSTRLERLRSRKPEKEDLDSSSGKDLDKAVLQCLEHFIWKKKTTDENFTGCYDHLPDIVACSSLQEYNDVKKFIEVTSKNCGAYHIGHLILEEVAFRNVPYHNNFVKLLDLDKLTRHWGQDRTPLCSLFLAELYYDHGLHAADEQKRSEFFSEVSYHLCKVIELISLDFHPVTASFSRVMNDPNGQIDTFDCMTKILAAGESDDNVGSVAEDSFCQQSMAQTSPSTYNNHFWVRFFWLSGCLSLSSGCKGKAIKEFSVCLSILEKRKKLNASDAIVPLPHCKLARWLTIDRVQYQINLLQVDSLLKKAIKMIKKGKQKSSINLLSPLLISAKGVYPDFVSGAFVEGFKSIELRALDILISACEKVEPMEIEMYLSSHRRKLQVLTWAAGLIDSLTPVKGSMCTEPKTSMASDSDHTESTHKHWSGMIYEEVKEISRCAARVKNVIDQGGAYSDFNAVIGIIGDIQSLLLMVMRNAVKTILGQKVWGMVSQTDQLESWCLVDAAIAFCKLQHLDPTVPIKAQVELIVAIHDLLAEYGLCCAGKDSEGEEGTFLKLAIKHLLALDVKMKSSLCSSNKKLEEKQANESSSLDGHEGSSAREPKPFSTSDAGVPDKDECAHLPNEFTVEVASECSAHDGLDKGEEGMEFRTVATDIKSHSFGERSGNYSLTDSENVLEDLDREKVELGIDNALDQSFFCLYGLNLKCGQDSLSDDDLATHKNTNRGDYQTKEQCADVFQYVLPYAKISSRAGMVKLRRVLRAIRKHFPQPPDDMLGRNSIHNFLENPDLSEDNLCEVAGSERSLEAIMGALYPDSKSSELYNTSSGLGSSDPYAEVYSNLYYFIGQAEEISATDKFPGFVLKKEGEEFVEQNANLFKYDLLYNPLRFESWQKLANIYDEEVDLLLNDGSKHINAVDWKRNPNLPQRVEMGRRRSRRCLLMSLALARAPAQRSQLHELLGLVYYDSLQNVVPFYDQRTVIPTKDATWRSFCQNSMKHFEKAFSLKPEWLHVFYLGKICEKMGYSSDKAFSYYSKAISLNPSAVDPLYRLHASRIKLLCTHGKQNLVVLQTVASYSFNESTKNVILDMFGWRKSDCHHVPMDNEMDNVGDVSLKAEKIIEPHQLDEAWHLLYTDCLSALEICVEGELKHFHKARYRLAQGLYKRCESEDLERAKDELAFCFRSSRSSFTINMWEIDSMVKKGRRKTPGPGGNRRCLEVSLPESSRKFITCIRKYILFYADLLEKTKDLYTLERAYSYVRTDKRFSLCLGDIAPIILGRYIKVLVSSMHNAETIRPTDSSMAREHPLERLFNILMDHVNQLADISNLPEVKCPELSESSLYGYIHQYIHHLEIDGRIDALEGINEKIRKRFKTPKLSNSNLARICRHASVAWCRSILTKLALITPLSDTRGPSAHISTSIATWNSDSGLLLFVDLQPDDISRSSLEGSFYAKGLEVKCHESLSRIKDVHVRQASDENMEAATTLLRCAYNFFRESSCGTFPSGIKLYTVPSLPAAEVISQSAKEGVDILDLSIPRKLLLWAYTLVHGRYSSISCVMKYFEENTKTRMRKAVTGSSASAHPVLLTHIGQTSGGKERNETDECPIVEEISSVSRDPSMLHASETEISLFSGLQLHHCSTAKTIENSSIRNKGDNPAD